MLPLSTTTGRLSEIGADAIKASANGGGVNLGDAKKRMLGTSMAIAPARQEPIRATPLRCLTSSIAGRSRHSRRQIDCARRPFNFEIVLKPFK